jgi:hypothetical protein
MKEVQQRVSLAAAETKMHIGDKNTANFESLHGVALAIR